MQQYSNTAVEQLNPPKRIVRYGQAIKQSNRSVIPGLNPGGEAIL